MPKRLINVGQSGDRTLVKLCTHIKSSTRYAALSYCWGPRTNAVLEATTSTLSLFKEGIAVDNLPRTLRDAVFTTRQLNLEYLWVDAICILQDSPEDKLEEITKMKDIYQNAYITIAAASTKSCTEGFLQRRFAPAINRTKIPHAHPTSGSWIPGTRPIAMPFQCANGLLGSISLQPYLSDWNEDEQPLNLRAWALQERLLSRRVLIYGTTHMVWDCNSQYKTFGGPRLRRHSMPRLPDILVGDDGGCNILNIEKTHIEWTNIVIDYSRRSLTFINDRLPALSAIAAEFGERLINGVYLAGLWHLPRYPIILLSGLLWKRNTDVSINSKHEVLYKAIAPSWSWASIPAGSYIVWSGLSEDAVGVIVRYSVDLVSNRPLGEITGGSIVLKSPARAVKGQIDGEFFCMNWAIKNSEPETQMFFSLDSHRSFKHGTLVETLFIQLTNEGGLILLKFENGCYKRISIFELDPNHTEELGVMQSNFFDGCEIRTVTII